MRLNRYTCQKCHEFVVTVDLDEGTTPLMMLCRATKSCNGHMYSSFYRVDGAPEPQYAWRKPTAAEYAAASPAMKQHFDLGGLDIHPFTPAPTEPRAA